MPLATLYASSHVTGSCPTPQNAVGAPDGIWTTGGNTNTNWLNRWGMQAVAGATTPTGTATVTIRVRKGSNSGNPLINNVALWRNNAKIADISSGNFTVNSTTGMNAVYTFAASLIPSLEGVQFEINQTGAGGGGTTRNCTEVDAITLSVNYDAPEPITGTFNATGTGTDSATGTGTVADPVPENLIYAEEFLGPLDLSTPTHMGDWRPTDYDTALDKGHWSRQLGNTWNINPNQHPQHSPFTVTNSVLTISARRTPPELVADIEQTMGVGNAPPWTSGSLRGNRTRRLVKYGYHEFRARIPTAPRGIFASIALVQHDPDAIPAKGLAEINVLETTSPGANHDFFLGQINSNGEGPWRWYGTHDANTTEWHTYAIDWTPGQVQFFRDGELIATSLSSDAAWFDDPLIQMLLNVELVIDPGWFSAGSRADGTTPDGVSMRWTTSATTRSAPWATPRRSAPRSRGRTASRPPARHRPRPRITSAQPASLRPIWGELW
jgi:hypothetical protein